MAGGIAAAGGGGDAVAGGSDCSAGPLGTAAGRLLLGGAMFCAGPGVCPGTSWGGRGSGEILKNWAFDSARKAPSQKPTAKISLAPPALVAAILIKMIPCSKSRQIQASPRVCHNRSGMLAHVPGGAPVRGQRAV